MKKVEMVVEEEEAIGSEGEEGGYILTCEDVS